MVRLTDYRVNNLPRPPSPTDRLSSEQSLTKDQFVIASAGAFRRARCTLAVYTLRSGAAHLSDSNWTAVVTCELWEMVRRLLGVRIALAA